MGLKVNTKKFNLGCQEITHLDYAITWYGNKTDPNKLQAIVDIGMHTPAT